MGALETLGRYRLPILAGIDPYGEAVLRSAAVDHMVRELEGSELARLRGGVRGTVLTTETSALPSRAIRARIES